MTLVIRNAELLFDNLGDASASPDLATEAVGFCTVPQEIGDEAHLIRIELGRMPGMGSRKQSSRTFIARLCNPPAHGSFGDAKSGCDVPLLPTELDEFPCAHSLPFPQVQMVELVNVHVSL